MAEPKKPKRKSEPEKFVGYTHLTPDDKRRATLKLEEAFIQKDKDNVTEIIPG